MMDVEYVETPDDGPIDIDYENVESKPNPQNQTYQPPSAITPEAVANILKAQHRPVERMQTVKKRKIQLTVPIRDVIFADLDEYLAIAQSAVN